MCIDHEGLLVLVTVYSSHSLPSPSQDASDQFLEDERDRVLTGFVVLIQKWVKGWILRRRFTALRRATITMQKNYRRHLASRRYRIVR